MKQRSFPFFFLLLLILTCFIWQSNALISSPPIKSSGTINYNPGPADGWLHTDGIYVKDSSGRIVALRGIHAAEYYYVNDNIVDIAKAHGATFLELGWTIRPDSLCYLNFAKLDPIIDLCERKEIYVTLNFLESSTRLLADGYATGWQDVIPIDTWRTIIERYANRPVVMGVKLIDEPHFNSEKERNMWTQAVEALRPSNPNLLWFTHIINYLRFSGSLGYLNPWQDISQVPENVLLDGGCWVGQANGDFNFPKDDYASADALVADIITKISNFQKNVPIPAGMAYGCADYGTDNAWVYTLRESGRQMETHRMYRTYYLADFLARYYQTICDRLLPDSPYPYYW